MGQPDGGLVPVSRSDSELGEVDLLVDASVGQLIASTLAGPTCGGARPGGLECLAHDGRGDTGVVVHESGERLGDKALHGGGSTR